MGGRYNIKVGSLLNRFGFSLLVLSTLSFALLGREEPEEHINLSSCDTCHDAAPVGGTYLTLDFETGDPLVADQVYEFVVSVPGTVARPGISIRVADARTSDFVGTFVDGTGNPVANVNGTTAVEAGKISETRLTGATPQTYTYRWKAPAADELPEGVRIEFYRVAGGHEEMPDNIAGNDGTDRRQLVLGDVSGGGGEEEEEELEQGAEQDTLGNSGGSGGAFGGDFGCSRSLAKSGFDLSFFIFLLFTLFGLRKHLQRRPSDTP